MDRDPYPERMKVRIERLQTEETDAIDLAQIEESFKGNQIGFLND